MVLDADLLLVLAELLAAGLGAAVPHLPGPHVLAVGAPQVLAAGPVAIVYAVAEAPRRPAWEADDEHQTRAATAEAEPPVLAVAGPAVEVAVAGPLVVVVLLAGPA